MKKTTLLIMVIISLSVVSLNALKAYMGIYSEEMSSKDIELTSWKGNHGLYISKVAEDSPAEKADIKKHDILLEIESEKVYTRDQLDRMLMNFKPGQTANVKVFRDKKEITLKLQFGDRKSIAKTKTYLGIYSADAGKSDYEKMKIKGEYGVVITGFTEDSPAKNAGLKKNDIILEINKEKVYAGEKI